MPEHVQTWVEPQEPDGSVVKVMAVSGRTSLRLKSWMPEHTKGARAVMLAGRALPSQVGATLSGPPQVVRGTWRMACRVAGARGSIPP